MNKIACLLAVPTLSFCASMAHAHHSSAPHFDHNVELSLEGKVTELKAVNPHAYLYFDVETDGEVVSWRCELSSATQLKRFGWTQEMFLNSESISIVGTPARREDNVCFLRSFTFPDGTVVQRNQDISELDIATAVETQVEEISHENRPDYLDNGQPNLEGPWVTLSFGRGDVEGIRARYTATSEGEAAVGDFDPAFDDPILQCHYVNLMNGWNHDRNVNDIYQEGDKVTIQYGFMDVVRTVHLNMEEHPENITPSSTGHSIGRWEGDTLVVDTIGFEAGVLGHLTGMKHSDQMHVIERFHVDKNEKKLYRDYTVIDPLYLVGEMKAQDVMALSNEPYTPYGCVELSGKNNIRPTDERYNQVDNSGVLSSVAADTLNSVEDKIEDELPSEEMKEQVEEKSWWNFWD